MTEHKYFTLEELTRSKKAEKLGIDNEPKDDKILENLDFTMTRLDEIREAYGKPIIINSGYRSKELNEAVGGVKTSYHTTGLAVDIRWDKDLFKFIRNNCKFDKLILEKSKTGKWIHLQFRTSNERNQVIILKA